MSKSSYVMSQKLSKYVKNIIIIWILYKHSMASWHINLPSLQQCGGLMQQLWGGALHQALRTATQQLWSLGEPIAPMLCSCAFIPCQFYVLPFYFSDFYAALAIYSQPLCCNGSTSPQSWLPDFCASSTHPELFLQQAVSFRCFGLIVDLSDVQTTPEPTNQQDLRNKCHLLTSN